MKARTAAVVLAVLAVLVVAFVLIQRSGVVSDRSVDSTLGYVVGNDRKIYVVDLSGGVVLRESAAIGELGRPTAIAYVAQDSLLFVASERAGRDDFFPLVSVRVNESFDVARTYLLDSAEAPSVDGKPSVYALVASPDGQRVFLGYVLPNGGLTTVLDPTSADIIGRSDVPVLPDHYLSQDGRRVAEVWPAGNRVVAQNGRSEVREWSGGVAVREVLSGAVVSRTELVADRGLYPPWAAEDLGPYLYIKPGTAELSVYDRVTGEISKTIDLQSLTHMALAQTVPVLISNSTQAALTMINPEGRGFVVVIDVSTGHVQSTIEVGPSPTNVVLAASTR